MLHVHVHVFSTDLIAAARRQGSSLEAVEDSVDRSDGLFPGRCSYADPDGRSVWNRYVVSCGLNAGRRHTVGNEPLAPLDDDGDFVSRGQVLP